MSDTDNSGDGETEERMVGVQEKGSLVSAIEAAA